MKLRTSYFNAGLLRKNLTRFAPLWGIYLVMGVLISQFLGMSMGDYFSSRQKAAEYASFICQILPGMAAINICYAALSAWLLFGDLHVTRMCYSLHAMPLRREGWFLTHTVSGLLFSLVPNAIVTVVMLFHSGPFFYMPLLWLLGSTLQFLCFFGIAVLSMHLTGQRTAAVGMYLLINFGPYLIYWLVQQLLGQFWNGVILSEESFASLCPMYHLVQMYVESGYAEGAFHEIYSLNPRLVGFGPAFLWAGFGLAALVAALLLYRRRHLESAGEFIAFRPVAPVVLVIYAVSVGTVLWSIFDSNFVVLLLGLAIGFFTGRMMLQRTLKVLSKRNFLGYVILSGCVLLVIGLAILDPMGITRWVPQAGQVEAVWVGENRYHQGSRFEDPEDIEAICQIHAWAVENTEADDLEYGIITEYGYVSSTGFHVTYRLQDGTTRERIYSIPVESEAGALLRSIHSQPEYIFGGYASTAEELLQVTQDLSVHFYSWEKDEMNYQEPVYLNRSQRESLIRALEQDWEQGNLVQLWEYRRGEESQCMLEFQLRLSGQDTHYLNLEIYPSAANTLAWLKENGYLPQEEAG